MSISGACIDMYAQRAKSMEACPASLRSMTLIIVVTGLTLLAAVPTVRAIVVFDFSAANFTASTDGIDANFWGTAPLPDKAGYVRVHMTVRVCVCVCVCVCALRCTRASRARSKCAFVQMFRYKSSCTLMDASLSY